MSELSFLLTLLLDHKLSTTVKGLIKDRIKEIELKPQSGVAIRATPPALAGQSPSTIANLMKDPVEAPQAAITAPAAAQAMLQRQSAIAAALNAGPFAAKPEKGRSSPRKF